MTESETKMVKWYKVTIDGFYSLISEHTIVKETPSSISYLVPWHDPRKLPVYARFRANKVRLRVINGVQHGEKKEKIKSNKHHWFDTERKARQYLIDFCLDKIKQAQNETILYQELISNFSHTSPVDS